MLALYRTAYERIARPIIFRRSPQSAHEDAMRLLSLCDRSGVACGLLGLLRRALFIEQPVEVGGVSLTSPLILAAGFVKGHGFSNEEDAIAAVHSGKDIIPGWRAMPQIAGPVEFGSFTRWPRLGNEGTIMWRDPATHSLQNRVGLRNPGAKAAAAFLARHKAHLPRCYGINIAVSPSQNDQGAAIREVLEAIEAFTRHKIFPAWYTLNTSCPNTEDDPGGRQTESASRDMCAAVVRLLEPRPARARKLIAAGYTQAKSAYEDYVYDSVHEGGFRNSSPRHERNELSQGGNDIQSEKQTPTIPLWVKLGPDLAPEQYRLLARVMHEVGVRAIVATNTAAMTAPGDTQVIAGVGGGRLYKKALAVSRLLVEEQQKHSYSYYVIGCGGVLNGASYHAYKETGVRVVQYWSALVYKGPLAAAIIGKEEREYARANGRRGAAGNRRSRVRATRANHLQVRHHLARLRGQPHATLPPGPVAPRHRRLSRPD